MTSPTAANAAHRRVRVCYFNTWAGGLEDAASYVARARSIELAPLVTNPSDAGLMAKARLDCDWYAENTRVFSSMRHGAIEFLPAWVSGIAGIQDAGRTPLEGGEERWFVTMGHQPQALGPVAGKAFELLRRTGIRHLYYAFDEASRFMPSFNAIAPHLDVLVHDEEPLAAEGRARLRPDCLTVHRSWVANVPAFDVPFNEDPEERILFLGSQVGMTPHRERQVSFLKQRFGERFVAIHDHSVGVAERPALRRFKVGLCPEGGKFATEAMAMTHTDRPFWSGCYGLIPVAEDSRPGGRLEELHQKGLVLRYPHADLDALARACERALAATTGERRRIYDHYNRHETVGQVVADLIHAAA